MTDKEIEAGIKRACECDCAPPSTGWTVNPFPVIRDYMERLKRRAEVAERALRRKCEIEADSTCPCDENSDKCKECAENRLCSTKYATQCYYEKAIQHAEREIEEDRK